MNAPDTFSLVASLLLGIAGLALAASLIALPFGIFIRLGKMLTELQQINWSLGQMQRRPDTEADRQVEQG